MLDRGETIGCLTSVVGWRTLDSWYSDARLKRSSLVRASGFSGKKSYFGRATFSLLNYPKAVSSPLGDNYTFPLQLGVLKSPSSKIQDPQKNGLASYPEVVIQDSTVWTCPQRNLDFRRRKTLNIED
jgi:hypothetical protein